MADFPAPVQVQTQNPGPQTFSSILGMAGQVQDLRQATAQADISERKNQELSALSKLVPNAVKSGRWTTPEGEFDSAAASSDIAQVAPVFGGEVASSLLSRAKDAVLTRESLLKLSDEQRASEAESWAALAGDQKLNKSKIIDEVTRRIDTAPTPGMKRALISTVAHMPNTDDPDELRAFANRVSISAGQGGAQTPSTVDTGGQIQPGATNKFSGAFTPAGAPINKTLAPTDQPDYKASVIAHTGAATGITERVQQAQAAANNTVQAQDALGRARAILDEPGAVNTGAGFQRVQGLRNLMSTLGIDTQGATDANSLVKNLARYEASRATAAGLGHTDAARELAHTGSPNVNIDNAALKGIVTQSLATEKALAAYANIQGKSTDLNTLSKNERDFRNIPNLIEGYEYGLARTPAEADEFLKKHGLTRAEMAKTRQAIKEFEGR